MAEEKKETPMLDPIAYRSDYNPNNIDPEYRNDPNLPGVGPLNANENYQEYGDDSNPAWQGQKGGLNPKYEGEGVLNTYIDYNPSLRTGDLDPNYLFGENARQQNAKEKGYIARRNDMIASALYNEGKTSREDIANYLAGQKGWFDSTESDRLNTIDSIWKRLGQQGGDKGTYKADESNADSIIKDGEREGTIYGKTSADNTNPEKGINTLSDANSPYTIMEEARVYNLKSLISMNPKTVAAAELSGVSLFGGQTMRDASQYYPEFIAEVEAEKKRILGQENVSSIASGGDISTMADKVDTDTQTTSYAVNNSTAGVSPTTLLKSIDERLIESSSAQSAKDLMLDIKNSEAVLKNRMRNLNNEANSVFKGDAPDYLVRAYVSNKTQEIQNQLSILADRYSSAYDIYKTELAHAERQAELDLKRESKGLDDYVSKNGGTSTNKNYTVAERNNNPTNMTVDFMKIVGAELGVDYEISTDSFVNSNGGTQYYAKLIGDPIETTIRVLDKALANGVNPFTTKSWSYINKLGLTKEKWQKMSHDEKVEMIKKWLPYEGGNMDNMAYYLGQNDGDADFDEIYSNIYEKYLSGDYSKAWLEAQTKSMGITSKELDAQAKAWKESEDKKIEDSIKDKPSAFTRKDGMEFDMSDTPTFDTLTYDQKNIVYQLLNLNKNPSTITKRQYGDDFEKILSAVKEINPNWSDSDYGQKDKVMKEWNTSSKNGSNSRNGTAIATAMDIYNIADEFGNLKWKDWNGMLNKLRDKLSDEKYTELLINLEVLASEYAGALKGNNAAPTEQEIADKKEILAANLGAGAMKEAAINVAKTLYNKNANEADNYYAATLQKPPLIVTKDVADRMYNIAGIKGLADRYQYTAPKGSEGNKPTAPKIDTSDYKGKSIGDALQS